MEAFSMYQPGWRVSADFLYFSTAGRTARLIVSPACQHGNIAVTFYHGRVKTVGS
jgi:hypothetical protein